jgi:hypothetical protein
MIEQYLSNTNESATVSILYIKNRTKQDPCLPVAKTIQKAVTVTAGQSFRRTAL